MNLRATELGIRLDSVEALCEVDDDIIAYPISANGTDSYLKPRPTSRGVRFDRPQASVYTEEQLRKLPIEELRRLASVERKRGNRTGLFESALLRFHEGAR